MLLEDPRFACLLVSCARAALRCRFRSAVILQAALFTCPVHSDSLQPRVSIDRHTAESKQSSSTTQAAIIGRFPAGHIVHELLRGEGGGENSGSGASSDTSVGNTKARTVEDVDEFTIEEDEEPTLIHY